MPDAKIKTHTGGSICSIDVAVSSAFKTRKLSCHHPTHTEPGASTFFHLVTCHIILVLSICCLSPNLNCRNHVLVMFAPPIADRTSGLQETLNKRKLNRTVQTLYSLQYFPRLLALPSVKRKELVYSFSQSVTYSFIVLVSLEFVPGARYCACI